MPTHEYRAMLEAGHKVPKRRLPRELWGRPEVWNAVMKITFAAPI